MRTAMRSEKELAKVGQERAIPTSVATALAKEMKDFVDEEAPLMMLMSSPGIKQVTQRVQAEIGCVAVVPRMMSFRMYAICFC